MNLKLRNWRKKNNLKQKDVANKLGINPSYISLLEKGKRIPSIRLALNIEGLTNGYVTPQDFQNAAA